MRLFLSLLMFMFALRGSHAQIRATTSTVIGKNAGNGTTTEYYYLCSGTSAITEIPTPTYSPYPGLSTLDSHKRSTTVYTAAFLEIGPTGLRSETYTITETCPCEGIGSPGYIPADFITTVVPCSVCGPYYVTVTLTTPVAGRVIGTAPGPAAASESGGQPSEVGQIQKGNGAAVTSLSGGSASSQPALSPAALWPAQYTGSASRFGCRWSVSAVLISGALSLIIQ